MTARTHRSPITPSVPPTSYPERVRTLSRQTSHSSLSSSPITPSVPPTSYPERVRTLARQTSLSSVSSPPITPSVPPTSYPERVQTLVRHTSHSSLSSSAGLADPHTRPPMLYDVLRSGNAELANPLRKGPLIFAAMSAASQSSGAGSKTPGKMNVQNPYPSPPLESASLVPSSSRRNGSVSSVFRGAPQVYMGPVVSPTFHPTELPPLAHKSSKSSLKRVAVERSPSAGSRGDASSDYARPRVLTKARPTTPQKPVTPPCHKVLPEAGDSLFLDEDPFARAEGVKMLKPRLSCSSVSEDGHIKVPSTSLPPSAKASLTSQSSDDVPMSSDTPPPPNTSLPPVPKAPQSSDDVPMSPDTPPPPKTEQSPPTPVTPGDYKAARQQRRGQWLEKAPPPAVAEVVAKQLSMEEEQVEEQPREPSPPPTYFPIMAMLSDANLLPLLLSYLSYPEWLALYSANKQVEGLFQSRILREFVLERYLSMVGYSKWNYEWVEPIALSLKASSTPLCSCID